MFVEKYKNMILLEYTCAGFFVRVPFLTCLGVSNHLCQFGSFRSRCMLFHHQRLVSEIRNEGREIIFRKNIYIYIYTKTVSWKLWYFGTETPTTTTTNTTTAVPEI